ncbi:hypothetical protein B0H13DRAFT_1887575 [Mycena leptocephala]|nr:hypothetical protein B0H13DRAFT_1887575 [Mycena leptocephala]
MALRRSSGTCRKIDIVPRIRNQDLAPETLLHAPHRHLSATPIGRIHQCDRLNRGVLLRTVPHGVLDTFRYQDKLCGPRLDRLDHRVNDEVGADDERAVWIIPDLRRHLKHAQNESLGVLAASAASGPKYLKSVPTRRCEEYQILVDYEIGARMVDEKEVGGHKDIGPGTQHATSCDYERSTQCSHEWVRVDKVHG